MLKNNLTYPFYTFLLLLFAFSASAQQSVLSQKVSLQISNQPIATCIKALQDEKSIGITFTNQIFDQEFLRSIDVVDRPLGEVLLELLAGTAVNFKLLGDEIVLIKELPDSRVVVRGYIRDAASGEAMIGANIFEPHIKRGASSNVYGFYSLSLPVGYRQLQLRYFGTGPAPELIEITKDTVIDMVLETALTLSEVIVKPKDLHPDFRFTQVSHEQYDPGSISSVPALAGESDLLRTAFLSPGVQTGGDGLGGLFVRGGSNDQNLILMDGVPVYNASHLFGFFSIFNSEAIRSSELYKAGIPARYGGRLSSVLDVRTREGNEKKFQVNGGIGLLSAKLSVEGPLKKDTSAFFISYRRSLLDIYLKAIDDYNNQSSSQDNNELLNRNINFQDLNAKFNYKLSDVNRVYLSLYYGGDGFTEQNSFETIVDTLVFEDRDFKNRSWGNIIGSFRWNHIFGPRLFSNTTVNFSKYNFESRNFSGSGVINTDTLPNLDSFDYIQFRTSIEDVSVQQDFDFFLSPTVKFNFGVSYAQHKFSPAIKVIDEGNLDSLFYRNILNVDPLKDVTVSITAKDVAFYVESEIDFGKKIKANIGYRSNFFESGGAQYLSYEPRLAATYEYKPYQVLKIAFDKMSQPLHLLQRSDIGLPADLWVPSTTGVAPQQSIQATIGWSWNPPRNILVGVDFYAKRMENLRVYGELANFNSVDGDNWVNETEVGTGTAYGAELTFEKQFKRARLGLNYTFAYSIREFEDINTNNPFPFRFDRRHFLKSLFIVPLNDNWTFTSSWVFGTGNGVTLASGVGSVPNLEGPITIYSERNSWRLPAYHRLDISAVWAISRPTWQQRVELGFFNAYNQRNPVNLVSTDDPDNPGESENFYFYILPIVPSVSYTFRW